jgi:hypothetical protein
VLARSLLGIFGAPKQRGDNGVNNVFDIRSLLCIGGIHFETGFRAAIIGAQDQPALGVSHILPNQWVVSGKYDEADGVEKVLACAASIIGGVDAMVMHDNLKGDYKATVRTASAKLGIPVVNHKRLRQPQGIPFVAV